jgi:hypothetical protein
MRATPAGGQSFEFFGARPTTINPFRSAGQQNAIRECDCTVDIVCNDHGRCVSILALAVDSILQQLARGSILGSEWFI